MRYSYFKDGEIHYADVDIKIEEADKLKTAFVEVGGETYYEYNGKLYRACRDFESTFRAALPRVVAGNNGLVSYKADEAKMQETAKRFIRYLGQYFIESREPTYDIVAISGTVVMYVSSDGQFNATQYKECVEKAKRMSKEMHLALSVCRRIEVLMPEMIKSDPQKEIKKEHDGLIEKIKQKISDLQEREYGDMTIHQLNSFLQQLDNI